MGFYAYKVDKGLLMANIFYGNTTLRILNRQNLYSGDGWRLLGPRELSKYILSDLNGTINPKKNPWGIPAVRDNDGYLLGNFSFYQMPHSGTHCFYYNSASSTIQYSSVYGDTSASQYNAIGWSNIDQTNKNYYDYNLHNGPLTSLFLYQYVESENATNIYY